MTLARFALSLAAMLAVALAYYPALWLPRQHRVVLLVVAVALILVSPLGVPAHARFLRLLASIVAVTLALKLFDLHVGAVSGHRPRLPRFVVFLWNPFSLVDRRIDARPDPPRGNPRRRLAWEVAATVAALGLAYYVFRIDWRRSPFALEHAMKVVSFFLVLFPFTAAAAVAWRMAGGPGRDIMHNPFAARTPADFWRRYNRPVHEFLEEDLFKPAAGPRAARRPPSDGKRARRPAAVVRATVLTFVVSALIHEYVFAVPIGRVQGYQIAFFLLQGLAVAATARVKPRGWRVAPWVAATFGFNLATGVLFFASLNRVVPIYQNPPPLWDEPAPKERNERPAPSVSLLPGPFSAVFAWQRERGAEFQEGQVVAPVVAGVSREAGLRRERGAVEQPD